MAQNIFESQFLPFPVWLPPHPFRFFRELFPNKLTQIPLFTFGFWKTDEKLTVSMELGAWRPGMLKVLQCHKNLTQQRMSLPKRPKGFPGGASGKEPACQFQRHKRHGFHPWVWKIPRRRAWQPTPVFLPGEPQGQRSLAVHSPYSHKESSTAEAT